MNYRKTLLALAVGASLISIAGCKRDAQAPAATGGELTAAKTDADADAFVARVNAEYKAMYPDLTAAQWLSSTYINDDSQTVAAKANERYLTQLNKWIAEAKAYEGKPMSQR